MLDFVAKKLSARKPLSFSKFLFDQQHFNLIHSEKCFPTRKFSEINFQSKILRLSLTGSEFLLADRCVEIIKSKKEILNVHKNVD